MRVVRCGLPVLILAAVGAWAQPAGAADMAGFGPRDGVVDVAASSNDPGAGGAGSGGGSASNCTWRVVIADDNARAIFGPSGERLFSDTGRWLQMECGGQVQAVDGQFALPEGGLVDVAALLAEAFSQLDPPVPAWSASPNGTTVPMVTQLPTWLWIDPGYWGGGFSARASTPSGRVWAEARATPVSASWEFGDGSAIECGAGAAFGAASTGSAACTHTFRHSSAGSSGTTIAVTVTFSVEGVTSLGGTEALGEVSRTAGPVLVRVAEVQALETEGR